MRTYFSNEYVKYFSDEYVKPLVDIFMFEVIRWRSKVIGISGKLKITMNVLSVVKQVILRILSVRRQCRKQLSD